ncbi:VOC family protein [uncultured Massilia sp.]|uniref:VOC family protein n=1 Tax=uncultured Massilia sp. TaxID=169973 RepID=UPI0025E871E0|nr:VOC family protein [uncultured Massilia sp.]
MFSHVFVGVSDFERALAFYRPLMASLGIAERFCDAARAWAGWQVPGQARPLFVVGRPWDGHGHAPGNGQMAAFLAADRATVARAHALALAHGGSDEGAPGLRPDYHAHYYGAYFRDPDGNKLCVVCHDAPPDAGSPSP